MKGKDGWGMHSCLLKVGVGVEVALVVVAVVVLLRLQWNHNESLQYVMCPISC